MPRWTRATKADLALRVDGGQEEERVVLMLWDIMGSKGVRDLLQEAFFSRALRILLVCDVTRPETLRDLVTWREAIERVTGPVPAVLLANKVDLKEKARLPRSELKFLAKEWDVPYLLTSAKTGENVPKALAELARRVVSRWEGGVPARA